MVKKMRCTGERACLCTQKTSYFETIHTIQSEFSQQLSEFNMRLIKSLKKSSFLKI